MLSKERIKFVLGIEELEAGQEEEVVVKTSSLKENLLMIAGCFILSLFIVRFSINYYQLHSIYQVKDNGYKLANQYVVSSSPYALCSIEAGDKVVIALTEDYNLTAEVVSTFTNGFLSTNQQGLPEYYEYEDVTGKVVSNPISWVFSCSAKFLNYVKQMR